ncbi:MAG TPA: phosphoethanolamine--lipid A transferase [Rhodocyclaceae bacterium]|nr:phosphoethanolamine--lipid A transferase [Rhodocyclaceae bacterium]
MTCRDQGVNAIEPTHTTTVAARTTFRPTLDALLRWRPEVAQESLLLAASVYFALVCNTAFWRALLADRPSFPSAAGYAVAVGVALVAVHFIVLGLAANRWTIKPLLALSILVASTSSFFAGAFGIHVDPGMMRNVLRTDFGEARELLSVTLLHHLFLTAGPPLVLLRQVRVRRRALLRALALRAGLLGLAGVAAVVALSPVVKDFAAQMRNHKEIRFLATPANALYSFARVLTQDAQAAHRPRTPVATDARLGERWNGQTRPVLFILVVGETARAANWGLNGGSAHDTTPQLARLDVINFPTVSSCGTNTEVSVPCMFSAHGRRNYDEEAIRSSESLLHVLQRAGLRVVWNDNQSGCKGVCARLESLRPDRAALAGLCDPEHCLDEALLASSDALLRDNRDNLVLVLHQLGNHGPAYHRRHPAAFRRFTPTCDSQDLSRCSRDEIINSYDNALLYTDHVLAQTIRRLEALQQSYDTALLYVSDHGESLGEKGLYLHGMPYAIAPAEQTRVPMLLWISTGYARRFGLDLACLREHAGRSLSHDHLFHSVLGLLDVRTAVHERALDFVAACQS